MEGLGFSIASGFFQISKEGLCVYSNEQTNRITGYSAEEMLGQGWIMAIHPRDRERVVAKWRRSNENQDTLGVGFRLLRKDGEVVWVIGQIVPFLGNDRRVLGYIATLSDVTGRKHAEKALMLSEERFSKAFNASPSMVAIYRLADERFVDANDSFLKACGYSRAEFLGRTLGDLSFWVEEQTRTRIAGLVQGKEEVHNLESRYLTKTGEIRTGLVSAEIIELNDKACMFVAINDITEQKRAEAAIAVERQRIFTILQSLPVNIALVAPDYSFRFANKAFCESFGESYGKSCYEALYGRKEPCEACLIDDIFEGGASYKWEQLHSGCPYQVYGYPFHDFDGTPLALTMSIDISDIKQLKEEMLRLDRLNLVGEMAAGIGHEIRNPMTTVRGFLQLLGAKEDCARYKEFFAIMIEELDRANAIITEYLFLAKNKAIELKNQNLNFIINSLFPIIQADATLADKYVELVLGYIPDLFLDEKEIRQLILNLARNGLEAMAPGGKITIRTYLAGNKVVLEVQDKGQGIAPDALKKLGTPFFTTKDYGTGLGLAVCFSIAKRHDAKIEVKTNSGGSIFTVQFHKYSPVTTQIGMLA
ncbi:MAG: PAS domain S-box protein [Desulfotomaculaceae bacterium]|nr:PAS domain S-box protein [Desulfotomaculaceae bacterium]